MFYRDSEIPNMTVLRHTYAPIAHYVMDKVAKQHNMENTISEYDALVIAYYLVKVDKYTPNSIFLGSHDWIIMDYLKRFSLENSCLKPGEERTYTPVKKFQKDIAVKVCSVGLATLILSGSIFGLARSSNHQRVNHLTEEYIAELLNDEQNNAVDIDEKVAKGIAKICNQDPDLIHICLLNAFKSYEDNELYHMDKVINYLKEMLNKDTDCYELISTCDVFLDYLHKTRSLNASDHTILEQLNAIYNYRNLVNGGIDDPLSLFNEHELESIQRAIKWYKSLEFDINNEHFKDLKEMVKNNGGRK